MNEAQRNDLGLEYTIYFSLRLTPFTSVSHSVLSSGFTFSVSLQKMNVFSFTYLLVRNEVLLKKIFSFIYFVPVLLFYLYNRFYSKSGTFVLLYIYINFLFQGHFYSLAKNNIKIYNKLFQHLFISLTPLKPSYIAILSILN